MKEGCGCLSEIEHCQKRFVEKPKTLAELREEIAAGRTKAADLAASYYERIAKMNPRLNVYLSLTKERALEQAARMDRAAAKGDPLGPLAGHSGGHQGRAGDGGRAGHGGIEDS